MMMTGVIVFTEVTFLEFILVCRWQLFASHVSPL